jgi:hypothetical protein
VRNWFQAFACEFQLVPLHCGALDSLSPQYKKDEVRYLRLLRASLTRNTKHLYFSHGYDLTRNCQRQRTDRDAAAAAAGDETATSEPQQERRWRSADKRFCWNRHAGETLIAATASVTPAKEGVTTATAAEGVAAESVIIPLMCGSFGVADAAHLGAQVSITIIARTSVARVGIRHHCRGSDSKGEVANFVETEQIVEEKGKGGACSSFVILRGSVPLKWSQPLRDFFWKYRMTIKQVAEAEEAEASPLQNHFAALTSEYGRVSIIDLLKQSRGDEALLSFAFSRAVSQLPRQYSDDEGPSAVRYVAYDFHSESAGGNVAALARLLVRLRTEGIKSGIYVEAHSSEAAASEKKTKTKTLSTTTKTTRSSSGVRLQKGVFRVNCKDCLDRTNLVQSAVARTALEEQLRWGCTS